jgi:hypothetical protein
LVKPVLLDREDSSSRLEYIGDSFELDTKTPDRSPQTLAFLAAQLKKKAAFALSPSLTIASMAYDEDMKKAVEEAQAMKDALGVQDLQGTTATTQEVETGSPRTPGYEPDYGQTLKDPPQFPAEPGPAQPGPSEPEPQAPSPSPEVAPQPEPEAVSQDSKVSEFDKWLEAAQQGHTESQEHGKDNDLNR